MSMYPRLVLALIAVLPVFSHAADGSRYALLVGVGTYRSDSGLNNLKYPKSDMEKLRATLVEIGYGKENVRLMTTGLDDDRFSPRRGNILKELKQLLAQKNPRDTVLVMLSGHGLQPRGKDAAYFCPSDADLKAPETWLDLNEVFDVLKDCKAGGKLLIADCCRDDPALKNLRGLPQDVQSVTRPAALKPPQSVASMFSCGNGEAAFEEDELQGGVFTHFLIQGLRGKAALDGEVEVKALAGYLQKKVFDYVNAKRGASQVPSFIMESDTRLVLAPRVKVIPPPAVVKQPDLLQTGTVWKGTIQQDEFKMPATFYIVNRDMASGRIDGEIHFIVQNITKKLSFQGTVVNSSTVSWITDKKEGDVTYPGLYTGELKGKTLSGAWKVPSWNQAGVFEVRLSE